MIVTKQVLKQIGINGHESAKRIHIYIIFLL